MEDFQSYRKTVPDSRRISTARPRPRTPKAATPSIAGQRHAPALMVFALPKTPHSRRTIALLQLEKWGWPTSPWAFSKIRSGHTASAGPVHGRCEKQYSA